jgi:hypothetical protein
LEYGEGGKKLKGPRKGKSASDKASERTAKAAASLRTASVDTDAILKAGRPPRTAAAILELQRPLFQSDDGEGLYFGVNHATQLRAIRRWIGTAQKDRASCADDDVVCPWICDI